MDLDPAAVQAATFALAKPGSLPAWLSIPALGRDMTPIAEIAVAAAAPLIARATADAIADKIEQSMPESGTHINTTQYREGLIDGMNRVLISLRRSHGSQAQTTEDGK
jgi:N-formylglutamate amidohydrolase